MTSRFLFLAICLFAQTIFAQNIIGSWKGELEMQGTKMPLIFHISKSENGFISKMDSPMQQAKYIPNSKTEFDDNQLNIENKNIGLRYHGQLKNDSIKGVFSQNGFEIPMIFVRVNKETKPVKIIENFPNDAKSRIEKLDNFISYLENNQITAGGISVFHKGKEVYHRNFGENILPENNPKNHLFQIGSITKTMMATILHQLNKEGKIDLNETLDKYYPNVPNADKITLYQMMNHTAGINDYVMKEGELYWLAEPRTDTEIMAELTSQKPIGEPGEKVQYSNSAYYLLTKILEKVTKKSFAKNLEERILKPLKMKETFSAQSHPKNIFPSYEYTGGWKKVKDFDFLNVVGVGDIAANPKDLNIFIQALFKNQLLDNTTLENMKPKEGKTFGYGMMVVPFFSKKFLGHSGGTYGSNSLMIYQPEDDLAISYTLNANRTSSRVFSVGVLSSLYNTDFEYPKVSTEKLSVTDLEKYKGVYKSEQIPLVITVFVENGVLTAQGSGQPSFVLDYVEKHTFRADKAGVKIDFSPQEETFILEQNQMKFYYKKSGN
ncbi:MAG: serine hydrolase domain-containing protein [Cruoricaptor ignavus]|nr:serine hydrolase domain-containing protein [Cruoricaptor ignavus]